METLNRKIKYTWPNKLSYEDRQRVVSYYLEGYGLYRIGQTFGVSTTTIEYHLKVANVFTPYKKPTLFGTIQSETIKRNQPRINRSLALFFCSDTDTHYYDEFGEKYSRPKSYVQIVRHLATVQANKKVETTQQDDTNQKPFILRVHIPTGTVIERKNGYYEISRREQTCSATSNSIYSL